ncbi:uncharacterized protein Z520_04856 [Fonsecaea multimorphosa CBS 102226]|uniref:Myb-like domain-containing protein n=1 Tax=Fonsecaea multimorphosa CBS 102226 TaxID=1442371 RepID=A0A0D2HBL1_9EURO|nr:uncharacterized protein Z520_04856 [Fonsecaea multimorphosa CBS 102226]KIX99280.1 hypothetical protein Z520_04856 [Fonsecaea multimorphosa CBS 102226]OAL25970.1 hypothetical protein AYO22_04597 [Fonsecaea multimorphosa]
MPFKWDPASERNLLLYAIAEMNAPPTSIWPRVAEKLGNDLNGNACSQKFYKLKKESEKILQGDATVRGDAATPVKEAKTAKAPASKATSGKKRKAADPDDGEDVKTPTKRKGNAKKEAPANPEPEVKAESQEEEANSAVKAEDEHNNS